MLSATCVCNLQAASLSALLTQQKGSHMNLCINHSAVFLRSTLKSLNHKEFVELSSVFFDNMLVNIRLMANK